MLASNQITSFKQRILITTPDKSSEVVILNYINYVKKMKTYLNDNNKFLQLGLIEDYDNTIKIESKLQKTSAAVTKS